jgi:lactate dehydrogenase-like 2-hydroxyacid dehydrogenase
VISIHLSFSPSTEKLIDTRELGWMKRDVILVNTWRGAVLDEVALIQSLKERKIAGAGLDVFAQEPLDKNNPLKELDNAILTSHTTGTNAGMRYTFSGGSGSVCPSRPRGQETQWNRHPGSVDSPSPADVSLISIEVKE